VSAGRPPRRTGTKAAAGQGVPMGEEARVVLITAPDVETASRLARALVEERLAACVNLVPGIRSIYRWEGEVSEDAEVLLLAKTRADRCDALAARIEALHPYELPEVVALPVASGSVRYLAWVVTESAE
jgi:periplasmic divalent cation tolerance protein